jgi:bifunctional non-homologous end joining protein LigD
LYGPLGDIPPHEQLARGKIDVALHGEKLRGGFTLVQTGSRLAGRSGRKRWLLVKHRDEHADPSWDIESPELDRSVLTGRTMKEIEERGPPKHVVSAVRSKPDEA